MSEAEEAGSLRQTGEEATLEWRIPDFYHSGNVNFKSGAFYFSNSRWSIILYPNSLEEPNDSVEVSLERKDSNGPKTVVMSLGIKKHDGIEERGIATYKIPNNTGTTVMGPFRFISKLNLMQRKSYLVPSDVLTVICRLSTADSHTPEVSLYNRLWNLSQNLRKMLEEKKCTDFVLKVDDCEFPAHRMILESRCDYFMGMLGNGFQENGKGAAELDDIEKAVFQCILTYLYTGEAEEMSSENVGKIYIAADRLLLSELKKFCVDYMKENLSHELICVAASIAEKYEELELEEHAMDYFARHADEIFQSYAWEDLKTECKDMVPKILEKVIVKRMKLVKQ